MTVQTCPACSRGNLRHYPRSRRSGRRNFRCTSCGLVGWSDRDEVAPVETVGLDTISVEQREAWFQLKRDGVTTAAWDEVLDELGSRLGGFETARSSPPQPPSSASRTVSQPATSAPLTGVEEGAPATVSQPATSAPLTGVEEGAPATVSKPATSAPLTGVEEGAPATVSKPRIYDIGAGDGGFLAHARERGFEVGGNELLEAAIEIARSKFDIELDLGDLSALGLPAENDAVTLWCVIAHVPEPAELLAECRDLLKPGGVLFLQTPFRCAVDSAALGALSASRGRTSRWVDRRVAAHHWILHTRRSMTEALERAGFVDVRITPKARYSLQAAPYLASLGLGGRKGEVVSRGVDRLLDKGLAPRIVLDAYARRPMETSS
ncbi:methyltransferase domain-containing protein [Nocardioides sp. JQ2195]|uniref:methyltransferase domain-containing protein n=1 Tax=Nocardioides sp. JQ2195 TaxID=2592334 RepID=UPI00143EAB07|nr:methyltransferase domain-containing protein [Nocardioides sp. JQ2195]QIX25488.1 methyltransferase domain-containing protein [Nocardioides sp. JQ2195]